MSSRDDFEFVLLPWEHRGAHFDPRPDALTRLHFAGAQRTVLLKARAERLFFRFADWPVGMGRQSGFAVTTPFSGDSTHAEHFFHEAIAQKQVARYSLHGYKHNIQGLTTLLWLINENGERQTGWAREWCDGDWVAWEDKLPSHFHHSIWDEQWYPSLPRAMYDPVWPTIARRRFSEAERQNIPVRWERGSREELSQLLRAYFAAFPDSAREVNEHLEEWGEYGATGDTRVRSWVWNAATSGISLRSTLWNNTGMDERCDLFADVAPLWAELMAQYNYAVGLTWHHTGQGDTERRENWWCETPVFDLDVPLPFSYPPSQHEQMEACLLLRDWLHSKVPDADLKEWFTPETPA